MTVENKILIIEDDIALGEALQDVITVTGFATTLCDSGEAALSACREQIFSLILSDIQLPGVNGLELLHLLRKKCPDVPIIMMTAFATVPDAVHAIRMGASDYLLKPFESEQLLGKIKRYLSVNTDEKINPVASDPASQALLAMAKRVATHDATVLISGASGTGKEILARFIHDHSPRAKQAFVAMNCAAIPENMLESMLFGHEKGAYTGAHKSSAGKFEQAQKGTILLDEISEMSLALQAKLLRVLQERECERLGGAKTIELDVRVIATTNRELASEVKKGNFREDLYYRLNVFPLRWLSLNERKGDIIPLAEYLLAKHARLQHRLPPSLHEAAKQRLLKHDWQGNAREMENIMQRALILQAGDEIKEEDIQLDEVFEGLSDFGANEGAEPESLAEDLKQTEFSLIMDALNELNGNRSKVADKLGISPRTLRYKLAKMREAGVEVP